MLSGCLNSFFGASSSVDSVLRLVYARKLQKDATGGDAKAELHGNVAFRNVRFCYPSRPEQTILNGLTFHASKGQTIALVGPSGSGKSTVISLLERFYDPSTGIIVSFASIVLFPLEEFPLRLGYSCNRFPLPPN
ncbi:unnamed protein product [Toxocara canis]|uniref:ABC transporter domain-containing protein n=1 Tax=Toxocara canis TaxID=6265 RepID=A0A183U429_TOXCA|nr:unnamed protein product [Toxocara canis]